MLKLKVDSSSSKKITLEVDKERQCIKLTDLWVRRTKLGELHSAWDIHAVDDGKVILSEIDLGSGDVIPAEMVEMHMDTQCFSLRVQLPDGEIMNFEVEMP